MTGTDTTRPLSLGASRDEALARAAEIVADAWRSFDHFRPEEPVVDEGLRALLAAGLPDEPTAARTVLDDAARALDTSLAQPRPRFFAFIGSSGLEIAVLGDLLSSCYDVNLAAWAAAASDVEEQTVRWIAEYLGYPAEAGAFTSGGTVSNVTALAAAREQALPGVRRTGMAGHRATLYCSTEAHYSVARSAEVLGLGSDAVRALPIDAERRVIPEAVAQAIDHDRNAGLAPIAVVATAGTTLTGAVDPIGALADVCAERGVWLHVDGAYGLPAVGTSAGHQFAGLERADSVTLDAHKWFFVPKACGVLLVQRRADLHRALAHEESYMPHARDGQMVDETLEYSRPFRALKLWLAFRAHGADAFRAAIDENLRQAQLLYDTVAGRDGLELLCGRPPLSIVPFRHVPADGRDIDAHNTDLVRRLQDDGRVWVAQAVVDGAVCLRPCVVNYRTTDDDIRALVDVTVELAAA